jgi:hypothetical protein
MAHRLITTKAWPNRKLDAVSRSADVSYGHQFLDSINTLRTEIPEDATIAVVGTRSLPQYEARDFLQYFLFPRNVVGLSCTSDMSFEKCIDSKLRVGVFLLINDGQLVDPVSKFQGQIIPLNSGVILIAPFVDD